MDNLLSFLDERMSGKVVVSGDYIDLLIWGVREGNGVNILGISLNQCDTNQQSGRADRLRKIGYHLAKRIGLPFIEIRYSQDLLQNPSAKINIKGVCYPRGEASRVLQSIWGTSQSQVGTRKAVNRQIADAFHAWARENLPTSYIRIDIDAVLTTETSELHSLIEIKQSTVIHVERWNPYTDDIRNYFLEHKLANTAGIDFLTLNHECKYIPVREDTLIGLHTIHDVDLFKNRIVSEKRVMRADELAVLLNSAVTGNQG
jgi:hypothetical protein